MTLVRERCVACRKDSPKVTDEEISTLRPQIPEWHFTETDGIKRLERAFKFRSFAGAMDFAAKVGEAALGVPVAVAGALAALLAGGRVAESVHAGRYARSCYNSDNCHRSHTSGYYTPREK